MDARSSMLKPHQQIDVRNVNLFDCQPCDLMIVPCSDTGTISDGFSKYLGQFGVNDLNFENRESLYLGNVFSKHSSHMPPLAFAVTVRGRERTNAKLLYEIGVKIAKLAERERFRTIASPLLCSGAGGVPATIAYEMLAKGFRETAPNGMSLIVCIPDSTTYNRLVGMLQSELTQELRPGGTPEQEEVDADEARYESPDVRASHVTVEPDLSLRLASYNPDTVGTEDAFSLQNEYQAFANLISSKALKPPLSIGLFGNWGAGKSFFMRQLEKHVNTNSASGLPAYHDKVAQITFNAWHYMDANLWASLMSHILHELALFVGVKATEDEESKRKQKALFGELDITKAQKYKAVQRIEQTKTELESVRDKINQLKGRKQQAKSKLESISFKEVLDVAAKDDKVQDLLGLAKAELKENGSWDSLEDIIKDYRYYTSTQYRVTQSLETLFQFRGRSLFYLFVAIGLLVSVGLLSAIWGNLTAVLRVLGYTGAFVAFVKSCSTAVRSLKPVLSSIQKGSDYLLTAADRIKGLQAIATREYEAKIQLSWQEYHELRAQQEAETKHLLEIEEVIKQKESEIQDIERGKTIDAFLEKRLSSTDYNKHLGMIAMLRNDLGKLCNHLQVSDSEEMHVDRIVLYIDDLDRCPAEKVVEVLQAIHLLLAFPLFVVVVGVDVRWIKRSLDTSLFGMAVEADTQEKQGATSLDYLEKIFQVPFRLKKLDAEDKVDMLHALIHPDMESTLANAPATVQQGTEVGARGSSAFRERGTTFSGDQEGKENSTQTGYVQQGDSSAKVAAGVEITLEERDYMERVLQRATISPRALKRFVNTFRLIKANPDWRCLNEKGEFLYEETLYLLAVSICCPRDTNSFFQKLDTCGAAQTCKYLNTIVSQEARKSWDPDSAEPELIQLLELYPPREHAGDVTLENLKKVGEVVARFSFSYS